MPDLNWYFSYNLFRLAGITQGIAGRIRDGTAANAKAMESAKRTVPLSQASWEYAQKAGATNLEERDLTSSRIARESGRSHFNCKFCLANCSGKRLLSSSDISRHFPGPFHAFHPTFG